MHVIEQATAEEAPAIATLLVASISELCGKDHGDDPDRVAAWTQNKTADSVRGWLADPRVTVLVSRTGTGIAAVGAFSGDAVLLTYVAPDHRFAGHSKALLARMEALMGSAGVVRARLTSTATARPFYGAAGWRDDDATVSPAGGGYPMVKELVP